MSVESKVPDLTDEQIVEIFSWVDLTNIPAEFIYLAKLTTPQGHILYLDGQEYRDYVDSRPQGTYIGDVEIVLNLDRFGEEVKRDTRLAIKEGLAYNDSTDSGDESRPEL